MRSKLVGIVNVTPDSFSDGGRYINPEAALAAIEKLISDGADIIDIGAESTRPGATPITPEEEWRRLSDVLAELKRYKQVKFSIDTRHGKTAERALEQGIDWVNDVSGFSDKAMQDAVKSSSCRLVMMHSLSIPADASTIMKNVDPVSEIIEWAKIRADILQKNGIAHERIIFDPGIGFGKTPAQSWEIIESVERFKSLGFPILIGHSRKSFLHTNGKNRDEATLVVSRLLVAKEVDYLRVHDIAAHRNIL